MMQRAAILSDGQDIEAQHLIFEAQSDNANTTVAAAHDDETDSLGDGLRDHERRIILRTLNDCHGSRKEASKLLNISPRTLRYKIAEMRADGIEVPGR